MDVLNSQVHSYEKELRALRDKRQTPIRRINTPLRSSHKEGPHESSNALAKTMSLEAAFFRPALRKAKGDALYWRGKVVKSTVSKLKPLNIVRVGRPQDGEDELVSCRESILVASQHARLIQASIKMVNLNDPNPRQRYREECTKVKKAMDRLEKAADRARRCLSEREGKLDLAAFVGEKDSLEHDIE